MSENKEIYKEGILSIIINFVLAGLKFWAGIVSSSVALTADAWHTLTDSISSIVVILGAKLSTQKPDKLHPFGHGRWEYISSFLIAIFLVIVAFEFSKDAWMHFTDHHEAQFGTLAIIVTIVSILGKEVLAQYAFYIGKKTNNSSVKADGWHHRSDALSSVIVLVGIFLKPWFWWIDSVLGIIVALLILYTAYGIIKEAISKLLGEELTQEEVDSILHLISDGCDLEVSAHHFHLHNYGHHKELTFHIKLSPELTIAEGHRIATKIENLIFEKYNYYTTIHVEELM